MTNDAAASDSTHLETLRERKLQIASEIADAFLSASGALEVYRLALARVTPLVDASFASVFLRDGDDPELLRLVCAQNWPQSSARFLSQMRIRVGRGPTGRAVADVRAVEVRDVLQDDGTEEWREPARELGFTSLISLPLRSEHGVRGALTFYFVEPRTFSDAERDLLTGVARQLARTVERADLIGELQSVNEQLRRRAEELERRLEVNGDAAGG
ncbi:MAG TPA: GAF domain-containing protein [Longimicrobiales bacterium]|nr:GAF domain-containing protein [Longimicrobiales bacterium]